MLYFTHTNYYEHLGSAINVSWNNKSSRNTSFCLGERVTFVCTIDDSAYQWLIDHPALKDKKGYTIVSSKNVTHLGPFNVSVVESQFAGRTSLLSVNIFHGLGNNISCRGANSLQSQTLKIDIISKCFWLYD